MKTATVCILHIIEKDQVTPYEDNKLMMTDNKTEVWLYPLNCPLCVTALSLELEIRKNSDRLGKNNFLFSTL